MNIAHCRRPDNRFDPGKADTGFGDGLDRVLLEHSIGMWHDDVLAVLIARSMPA